MSNHVPAGGASTTTTTTTTTAKNEATETANKKLPPGVVLDKDGKP